jgi:hypothetical protein
MAELHPYTVVTVVRFHHRAPIYVEDTMSHAYKVIGESKHIYSIDPTELEYSDYYNFEVASISLDVLQLEPVLSYVHSKFNIRSMGVLHLPPNRCYKWHQDTRRGASINMMLSSTESHSHCLFAKQILSDDQIEIEELVYSPKKLYLLNTQIPHTVVNFDSHRYMFSLEFEKDKSELGFEDISNLF